MEFGYFYLPKLKIDLSEKQVLSYQIKFSIPQVQIDTK